MQNWWLVASIGRHRFSSTSKRDEAKREIFFPSLSDLLYSQSPSYRICHVDTDSAQEMINSNINNSKKEDRKDLHGELLLEKGRRRKRLTSDLQRSPLRLVNNRSRLDHHVDRPRGECVTEDIFDRLQAPPSQHAPSVSGPFPLLPHRVSSISPDPVTYLTGRRRVRGNRIDQCPYWLFSSWNRLPPPPPPPGGLPTETMGRDRGEIWRPIRDRRVEIYCRCCFNPIFYLCEQASRVDFIFSGG